MIAKPAQFLQLEVPTSLQSRRDVLVLWVQSALIATVVLTGVDLVGGGERISAIAALQGAGLAVATGLVVGSVFGLLMCPLATVSRRWIWLAWITGAGLAFASLADSLNAFSHWGGRHHTLALRVLGVCCLAVLVFASISAVVHPSTGRNRSWIDRRSARWRYALAAALVAGGLILSIAERNLFQGSYESGHWALRLATWHLALLAVFALRIRMRFSSRKSVGFAGAGLFVLCAVPFFTMTETETPEAADLLDHPLAGMHLELVRTATDFDQDGHSSLLGGGDCEAFNPEVSPSRREVFGNGIDEDCMGGDATRVPTVTLEELPIAKTKSPVNVVLITVDTLRADRMSLYGHKRNTTPNLDSFSEKTAVFEAAYTTGGWTSLAVPSLMRGLYPRRLDWTLMIESTRYRYFRPPLAGKLAKGEKPRARFLMTVEDRRPTIAELLKHRGMSTAAVVDGGFTEILAARWGAARGFDEFVEVRLKSRRLRNDAGTTKLALRTLKRLQKRKHPYFLWVHYFGPHAPSSRHKGIPDFGTSAADQYDHEIAYMDGQVGQLLKAIEQDENRSTDIFFTSDHGERIHNAKSRGHGSDFRDDTLRVPLLVKSSHVAPGRRKDLVSTVDILPTILTATESAGPPRLDGFDLSLPSSTQRRNEGPRPHRVLFAETFELRHSKGQKSFGKDLLVAIQGDRKLVIDRVRQTRTYRQRSGKSEKVREKPEKSHLDEVTIYLDETGGVPQVDHGPGID